MIDVPKALTAIEDAFGDKHHQFRNGYCHDLALALYMANDRQGELLAGLRTETDADGEVGETIYSHMVYLDPQHNEWDMYGDDATAEWENQWPEGREDEDGVTSSFSWEGIEPDEIDQWVKNHGGTMHPDVLEKVLNIAKEFKLEAVNGPSKRMLKP